MSTPPAEALRAMALARAGDLASAVEEVEKAVLLHPNDLGLLLFAGTLCCRSGNFAAGLLHFRHAHHLNPADPLVRLELARALLSSGDALGAAEVVGEGHDLSTPLARDLGRLRAHTARELGEGDAAARYRALVTADPKDFESWQGLGLSLLAQDPPAAEQALTRALALNPNLAPARLGLGRALAAQERWEEACATLASSTDPDALDELGRAQAMLLRFDEAEASFRRALALRPDPATAASLAGLLERTSQLDSLETFLAEADVPEEPLALVRARLLRRRGDLPGALAAAQSYPHEDDPYRAQEIGEVADRLGDAQTAFAAFERMNALILAAHPEADAAAGGYRATIATLQALTTPEWYASWRAVDPIDDGRRDPVFLYGFPRSGTTLLDTMLMAHPDVVILEEEPAMQRVAEAIGDAARLPDLSVEEIAAARAHYWREVDAIAPEAPGKQVIDKLPLGLVGAAYAHRLFPNARYIFAERHPCDAVLSCFITRFRLNAAMNNFLRLGDAARLYDQVLRYWGTLETVLPLPAHRIRYERIVADAAAELRPLVAFLGLDWREALLDHAGQGRARGPILTPSYSQVIEPLYNRASGRWRRYADKLDRYLPLLRPWAERMGYSI